MPRCTLCKFIFSYHLKLYCVHTGSGHALQCHVFIYYSYFWCCMHVNLLTKCYLQNKTREQLTISCGVVMTSSPLDSGSVRFSACENCCSDAICTPPSFDMVACLEIFCHFRCTYGGATWTNPLTSPLYFLSKKSHAKNIERLFRKKEQNISQKFLWYKSMM